MFTHFLAKNECFFGSDTWCLHYCPVMWWPPGWRSFIAERKQDAVWFLEVTPLFPLSGEVRQWKTQPWELSFSITGVTIQSVFPTYRLYMGGPHRDNNGRQSIFGDPFCREVFCYTCTWSLATVSHSVGKTEMSGFMIMWLNRDEDNPHSQVKKKKHQIFECSVRSSALSLCQLLMMLTAWGCSRSVMDMLH